MNPHRLSQEEKEDLARLRATRRARHARIIAHERLTVAQKAADGVARLVGSWTFIILQTTLFVVWVVVNVIAWTQHWDPYPFILLNLALSFQAAFTAPIIMMSQNRQSEIDRIEAHHDFEINRKAELEIEALHEKVDLLREQDITRLLQLVETLSAELARMKEK